MSSYVDSVLAEGVRIIYRAAISHWKFFLSYFVGSLFLMTALGASRVSVDFGVTACSLTGTMTH